MYILARSVYSGFTTVKEMHNKNACNVEIQIKQIQI